MMSRRDETAQLDDGEHVLLVDGKALHYGTAGRLDVPMHAEAAHDLEMPDAMLLIPGFGRLVREVE